MVNSTIPVKALISDCVFKGNMAVSLGGGLYIAINGYTAHTATLQRVVFKRNYCEGAAGGLAFGYLGTIDRRFTGSLTVYNSEFTDNRATIGGAIYILSNCMIIASTIVGSTCNIIN